MKRQELLDTLRELQDSGDTEIAHHSADNALVEFINDKEIEDAYDQVPKWYA